MLGLPLSWKSCGIVYNAESATMKSAVFSRVQCELKILFSSTKVGLRGVLPLGALQELRTSRQCTLHCCEASLQHIDREQWQKQQFDTVVPGALRRAEDCAGSLLE